MKNITIGTVATEDILVTDLITAKAAGSGSLDVLGTPFMLALMEKATCSALNSFLDENETSVGIAMNITHDKASGIGEKITAVAKISEVDGRAITFDVGAKNENDEPIGAGQIKRFVVDKVKFMGRVNSK